MGQLRGSFLVRYWELGRGERRLEIEHIQSGDRVVVASPAAAWDWITAHAAAAGRGPPSVPGRPAPDVGRHGEGAR
jgi:hypothetical protein